MKSVPLAILGQLLLWLGFLGGAFASVMRLEIESAPWSTIPWPMYALCSAIGVVGVVLLRRDKAIQRTQSAASESELESVWQNLIMSSEKVAALHADLEHMTCEAVLEYIDHECVPLLADFADSRMAISNRYGAGTYAAVMTEFASGERYLNRAWSAAADGYVDEVEASVAHAKVFLNAAVEALNQAVYPRA